MDGDGRLPWIIAVILLFVAVFFAVTEISFAASSKPRLKTLADAGNRKAEKALEILNDFDKAISTILIGTNIVHISIASLVTVAVTRRWGLNAVSVSTIITTMVVFFAGEMLPKSIAKKYPEPIAMFCASPLKILMTVFTPLSAFFAWIGSGVAGLVKGDPELSVTEDELYDIIEDMTEEGTLDEEQGDLISSALQFGDVTVESILTPRVDVIACEVSTPADEILQTIKNCSHSRLPVYEGSIDNVIGILQIRKFIKAYLKKGDRLNLKALLDEPYFVHQSTNIDDLLPIMSKKINMAIVTDNYGGTLGVVTVEDILEELVGEIWDEDDVVEEPIVVLKDGSVSANAEAHAADVFEELGFEDYDEDEFRNLALGAWAFEQFGRIPESGDSFEYKTLTVTVTEMDHNRITRLKVGESK